MKQVNEYYACNGSGYVQREDVNITKPLIIKQIPVMSRCNKILPSEKHKIQVTQPVVPAEGIQQPKQMHDDNKKGQNKFSSVYSEFLIKNSATMLQKDQVYSVHMEDNTSARTITQQKIFDLDKSSYTNLCRSKADMKRSLFQTNTSKYTNDTNYKQRQKIDMIISELLKQKQKRKRFQEKYQAQFNMITTNQKVKTSACNTQDKLSQKLKKFNCSMMRNKRQKKTYHIKSNTQNSSESDQKQPIVINYRKAHRNRTPPPIFLNLESSRIQQQVSFSTPRLDTMEQKQQFIQIKQNVNQLTQQMAVLDRNVQFLQKRLDEHQERHQKEQLMNQLKEKQRRIQQVMRQNQEIRWTNQSLTSTKLAKETGQNAVLVHRTDAKAMLAGILMSFLVMLLALNLKGALC